MRDELLDRSGFGIRATPVLRGLHHEYSLEMEAA
jgi:hypothetical protein